MELPLKDIHLPEAISMWQLSLLSWALLIGVFVLVLFVFLLYKKLKKPTLKKQALNQLEEIKKAYYETHNPQKCLSEISIFLRRAVLSSNKCENSAGITGKAWLDLLDKTLNTKDFSRGVGLMLVDGPYKREVTSENMEELLELISCWVKKL